jgi:hypothetical protein
MGSSIWAPQRCLSLPSPCQLWRLSWWVRVLMQSSFVTPGDLGGGQANLHWGSCGAQRVLWLHPAGSQGWQDGI